jgi:GTPase SAR1 family protein
MTLTVVVGSSGSGKTTFLNDVHKSHKCNYIRQYHHIRPYVKASKIPNFDPKSLPYWDIYEREGKADTIRVGGTMGGEFTAGLSGGQRKLLLFELISQRFKSQKGLLICLDEPFAGVTDDFVPFIVKRLNELREKNNILLVTNDHVKTLKNMADNTITVSAIDRTTVKINHIEKVDRNKAILSLSVGGSYVYETSMEDLKFFFDVEVMSNAALKGVLASTTCAFALFLLCFWGSAQDSAVYVLIAGDIMSFYAINPYLVALVDWRDNVSYEAEALLHSSKSMNMLLKTLLTVSMVSIISLVEFGVINSIISGLQSISFLIAIFFDSASLTFPYIFLGLYSKLPAQSIGFLSTMPFLLTIFFSTTYSPGAGVNGLKELRYLFPRFYFWCMVPQVENDMENCPESDGANLLYLILTALIGVALFVAFMTFSKLISMQKAQHVLVKNDALRDEDFLELQVELYGESVSALHGETVPPKNAAGIASSTILALDQQHSTVVSGGADAARTTALSDDSLATKRADVSHDQATSLSTSLSDSIETEELCDTLVCVRVSL